MGVFTVNSIKQNGVSRKSDTTEQAQKQKTKQNEKIRINREY